MFYTQTFFSFNSHVCCLTRSFITSTRAFSLLTSAFSLLAREFEHVSRVLLFHDSFSFGVLLTNLNKYDINGK